MTPTNSSGDFLSICLTNMRVSPATIMAVSYTHLRRMLCGMAAGIMLAASVWSLLLPAIERAEAGILPVWLAPAAGLVLGAVRCV